MANNNNYLFYRKYYEASNADGIKALNKEICKSPITEINENIYNNSSVFELNTIYPGLLIGSGYGHDYKSDDEKQKSEAFKIGFFFDYTTGMPVIPGSSVKGMLRSCFPQESVKTKELSSEFKNIRTQFIKEVIKEQLKISCNVDINALEDEIFHGLKNGNSIPIYKRDIFFDAVPVRIINSKNQLFDNDYITPHVKKDKSYQESMLKNPEPIKFLKVSSNVVYRFEFLLHNSQVCCEITKEKKLQLFKYLLLTIGIGAKTNVGYGQFTPTDDTNNSKPENNKVEKAIADYNKIIEKQAEAEKNKSEADKRLVKDAQIECFVTEKDNKSYYFGVDWDTNLKFSKQISKVSGELNKNDKVIITIVEDYYPITEVKFSNNIKKA